MFPDQEYAGPRGSFYRPVVPPTVDPDASPTLTLSVACAWLPYIRGSLYQLLLQATWDTDAAGLALAQARVFNLIDLFVECAVSDLPFACPFDFGGNDGGFALFPSGSGFTPSTRGTYFMGSGWLTTQQTYAGGSLYTNGAAISKALDPSSVITSVDMGYDLTKGFFAGGSAFQTGIVLFLGGSVVATQLVDSSSDPDGFGKSINWSGSLNADTLVLVVLTENNDPTGAVPGNAVITNCDVNGTGAAPC